jgi:hypothetical protein
MAKRLTEDELSAIISQQIELAKTHDKHARESTRDKAIDYFMGHMDKYVPPEVNRSRVVSRDVADTIGWLLPDLMKVFTASGRMAIAEPDGEDDTQMAEEATEGLNYVFWKDNKGYEIVYNATWDALLMGNGIVKTYYDDTPVYAVSFHSGLTEDQVALLLQDDDVEVLAKDETEETLDIEGVGPVTLLLFDLKVRRKKLDGKFIIDVIPPEEFLIDADAIDTDEAAFTDHWQKKTRSALVTMGYDKDEVWTIPVAARNDTPEEIARRRDYNTDAAADTSMELVDYHECYVRVDVDGDGEAELVRACYGGGKTGKLLSWEVWEDEHPFDDIPCEPIPHRWDARSVADETIDIQDIKTVLSRQFLNNLYWVNNPQRFAQGKIKNPEMLESPIFGSTVFGDVGSTVTDLPVPFIGDKALLGLTHFDEVRQARTGVGRQSMALDPEALQNQTAEASRNNRDAGYSQKDILARNMAEWGWSKVFRKLMRLMIKHQKQPRKLMLNDKKAIQIDPRFWNADMKVTINTGLGTGSRDRDLAMLGNVLQSQLMLADRFMAAGSFDDAIDMLPLIISTMEKMAEAAGIRNPEDYYPEYTEEKVAKLKEMAKAKSEAPDPALALEQAKGEVSMQLEQAKGQTTLQVEAGKNQLAAQQAEVAAQGDIVKNQAELEADLQTAAADREKEITLEAMRLQGERDKQEREIAFRVWEKEQTFALEREKMANAAHIASLKPKPEPGKPAAN